MATPSADASTEDLVEELQLHEVILQSLDEQRPDAVEEKQEIIDTIKGLQTRLAQLTGESPPESQHDSSFSHEYAPALPSTLSGAQMDGAYDVSPFDFSPRGAPSPRSPLRQFEGNAPFPVRKRRHNSELSDNMQPPTKRPQGNDPPRSSNPQIESTQNSGDLDADSRELRLLLGLDDEDTMVAFQDEQKAAEDWLRKRTEQERRDREFARVLHDSLLDQPQPTPASSTPQRELGTKGYGPRDEGSAKLHRGLFDQPRPSSAISSSSTDYSGASLDLPLSPAPKPQLPLPIRNNHMSGVSRFPTNGHFQRLPDPFHSTSKGQLAPKHLTPLNKHGADDDDIQEITRNDFRPRDQSVRNRNQAHGYSRHYRPPPTGLSDVSYSPNMHMLTKELPYSNLAPLPPNYSPLEMMPLDSKSGLNGATGPAPMYDPNGATGSSPMYGPNVMHNTMARLNAGRQLLQQAGKSVWGGLPDMLSSHSNPYGPQSTDPLGSAINYGSEFNFNNTGTLDFLKYTLLINLACVDVVANLNCSQWVLWRRQR